MKKVNWVNLTIVVLLVMIMLSTTCGKGRLKGFFCNKGGDTISVKIDSVINVYDTTIVFVPVPVKVTLPGPGAEVHDTLPPIIDYRYAEPCDSTYTKAYFKTVYYKDTLVGRNWRLIKGDTVTQNRITGTSSTVMTYDTTITKTITLTQPKKIIVSYGFNYIARVNDPFYGGGFSLGIKGKNDNQFLLSSGLTRGQPTFLKGLYFQGHAMFPIRLFKKRN